MSEPNPKCLKAVRAQVEKAHEALVDACKILRRNGWPENADELMRSARHVQPWILKDGWLDHLEKPPIEVSE